MSFPQPEPTPPQRERAFNLPAVVIWLVALMALIEAGRGLLSPLDDFRLTAWLAFVPARVTLWLDPGKASELAASLSDPTRTGSVADRLQLVRFLVVDSGPRLWTVLTYGLLHGSWMHLISNMVWLAAFGSPVARRLGPARFLNLLALSTIAGALLHWWSRELDILPLVGASAGVSGATAAALRFVFAPGLPFGALAYDEVVRRIPASRFGHLWRNRRAMLFMAIWFVTNLIFGAGLIPILGEETSIAWEAHIGGFVAGLLLFPLFDKGPVER